MECHSILFVGDAVFLFFKEEFVEVDNVDICIFIPAKI
jgi:hypothetical protein